ncbi:MAG TPA: heavy metal translocating P-type ATPase metal-binding domain-containing protein, partial [Bacteroidia bacterium]|nr:heavy metal translocating P-type ATPase metal-binding domain-containing protein [Bacteroidia bacterium]
MRSSLKERAISSKYDVCYHCGEPCVKQPILINHKPFCCEGCKLVYELIEENNLCTYYTLNSNPGISPDERISNTKFHYLDEEEVSKKLIEFTDGKIARITFFIPKIHCSSCIWLLENLHKIEKEVISSSVNFLKKEATVIFNVRGIKLSELVSLLAHIGYEPLLSLNDLENRVSKRSNKIHVIKIGIAGFCFGNIMMLSFPEYFSMGDFADQVNLRHFFGFINLVLAIPVLFYSASDFFVSAWKSIRYRYINIDVPISLAIIITFLRSVFEILSYSGAGYLDSMTGIVFFMLIGRYFQNRTYETISFDRDYKSYFPIGVIKKEVNGEEVSCQVADLKKGDRIMIRNNELIPSDSILISEETHVDYSFITGESAPVKIEKGEFIYAGGKQLGGAIELTVFKASSQSYLTQLWNKDNQTVETAKKETTFIDKINNYFTITVLLIAGVSAIYWAINDSSKILNAFTAVLIVACPCGLLLTSTFTNGSLIRIFGKNKFYLKNTSIIDKIRQADTILFDKTGTITQGSTVYFEGQLTEYQMQLVASLTRQSSHPISRKMYEHYSNGDLFPVINFKEYIGKGIRGTVDGSAILLGSEYFVTGNSSFNNTHSGNLFLKIGVEVVGYFHFHNAYRAGLSALTEMLSKNYNLKLISGDNDAERKKLKLFFDENELYFNQKPENKQLFVKALQEQGKIVMMIGDGLNDAGALKQSNVGIAITDDTNNFSPACDAILDGSFLY